MKGKKFLLSCWLATAAFCLLQIVAGPNGLLVTALLKADLERLDTRLAQLEADNTRLQGQFDALRTSADAIRLEARQLGWFPAGQVPVKVVSGSAFALPAQAPDFTEALPTDAPVLSDLFFRAAWPLFFVIFFGAFSLWDLLRARSALPPALLGGGRLDLFRN